MKTEFDLAISFIVKTSEPIEVVSLDMGITPTGSLKKGEAQHSFQPKAENNTWWFRERYERQANIGISLQKFFANIPEFMPKVHKVMQYANCVLRISVVSVYGQIWFSLSPKDIQLLSQIDVPVEVSIFSYGDCVD